MKHTMKRNLAIVLAACIGTTNLVSTAVLGDSDATAIRQLQDFLLGRTTSLSGGDVNGDGKVNGFDLCCLKRAAHAPDSDITDFGTEPRLPATMYENFRDGSSTEFFASDGWTNGSCFDCGWYEKNTSLAEGCLTLTIDQDSSGKYHYSGAEYRTYDHYGYGYYETSMQAIKNPGVVSSFFTYTGPSEDNPWDEIDIEILGKDTTKVQLNYYTNGVGGHEVMYDLGFDASQGYHTYGFDWQPDHITWYVDGKAVYTAYDNIPSTPGRIMMNTWPGTGVDEWLAPYDGKTPLTARYQWVTYHAPDEDDTGETTPPTDTDVTITAPTGSGSGVTDNFEGTGTDWTGRGAVQYGFVSNFTHGGKQALYVQDRTASWNGLTVASSELQAGATYAMTAYAGFQDDSTTSMGFSLGLQYDLNGKTEYIGIDDGTAASGSWCELSNTFTIPAGATAISLYVQSAYTENPTAADLLPFYLDDVTLSKQSSGDVEEPDIPENPDGPDANVTMYEDFRDGSSTEFFASDGWTNGSCFDCGWYEKNTSLAQGCLTLTIDQDSSGKYHYSGAEYRTYDHYGYGYYETSMQAIKNPGVVSSFFTYTGPSEDNPWDEIDVEILGKDTTKVQLNYYTNGVGGHEVMYDLGFDASEGYHTYGFDWQPDHITWYVDGKAVYTAYDNIPSTPGRIMMNTWPGTGVDEWLAPYDGKTPLTARYQWVTYKAN